MLAVTSFGWHDEVVKIINATKAYSALLEYLRLPNPNYALDQASESQDEFPAWYWLA